ncbi:uncharacterized protein F5891DRAFT_1138182 [Suillus fuscotomentosus]|uniref:Uncharacterized protein n=1 Tax=Suillus fuscotomentosus TaxID=1912939 RepID=A0AAD4HRR3_9AGAM|nr:uncharacterized protein F5891DRAFT_1138182 [Suillus fuscotomentosus]KAG1906357.1 hypothetical protein F5891DRAFT_1138182 [Suillus fuscotomentosus]
MVRTKLKSCKGPPSPHAAEASPRKRRKGAVPTGNTTLPAINKVKERAKQQHKHAKKTRENYNGYVERGQTWLKAHFTTSRGAMASMDSETVSISTDAYEDPTFRDALERMPNQHSDKALALLISFKCFHENCGQSTCDGTYSAFKKFWEEADGDTYRGRWHFNEARLCWEGNPASSAEVQDIIKSVKHKTSSEGGDRTHSIAMSKGFMDRILAWTHKLCPPKTFLGLMRSVLAPDTTSTELLTLESRELLTKMTMYQAFSTTAWNLWTRYLNGEKLCSKDLHTYFEVFLSNRKGWQRRVDKGTKESDLRSNRYKLYPQPDLPGCDCFFWLLLWLTFLEVAHYGRKLEPEDYIFPAIGANGIVHCGEPISHDTVQAWIDEATTEAGIPRGTGDNFTTHTYRRGGAQWRWMFAPIGQRWTLARVRWWGSWAENENCDTLIRYLLDELSTYENDHSDALCPTQREADASLLGEHLLVKPVCIQDLQSMHECISADVAGLRSDLRTLAATLYNGQLTNLPNSRSSTGMCNAPHSSTLLSNPGNPCIVHHSSGSLPPSSESQPCYPAIPSSTLPQPSALTRITDGATILEVGSRSLVLPEKGLVIPDVPTRHPDGTHTPRAASWRQIVKHWTDGDPKHGLLLPLRDWPPEWIRGKNKKFFAMKYHQRSVIALEFLDQFNGHEPAFLAAYPEATVGHTALLRAINRAKKERGDIIPRK